MTDEEVVVCKVVWVKLLEKDVMEPEVLEDDAITLESCAVVDADVSKMEFS